MARDRAAPPEVNARPPIRVLLVEDNLGDARLVEEYLREATGAFVCRHETRLSSALTALEQEQFDIVLLDLSLPDASGDLHAPLQAFERVRAAARDVAIIVVTGFENTDVATAAVRGGAQDYLVKGRIEPVLLERAVRYALERQRLSEELALRVRQLERANQDLEDFARVAGHDLREPLRTILSFTELVIADHGTALPPEAREHLERVERAAHRLHQLIDDITALLRAESAPVEPLPVPLALVVEAVTDGLEALLRERGAQVRYQGPDVLVQADRPQLELVLTNLIVNGVRHNDDPAPLVRVSADHAGPRLHLAVADNGVGIAPEDRERVFQPFVRGRGARGGGSGTGLAIVKRIVDRHGGRIWIEPGRPHGTQIHIELPTGAVDGGRA